MQRKRTYRAVNVKRVDVNKLVLHINGQPIVVGVDVAKEKFMAWLEDERGNKYVIVEWKGPLEHRLFVDFLQGLGSDRVEVAMEPSGSYGATLRNLLWKRGIAVFRVSGKRTSDACEVYDGVPSSHDAKSAGIVAKLHRDGASEPWPFRKDSERDLKAVVNTLDALGQQRNQNTNRLEALMARHWPEVGIYFSYDQATFLELLIEMGSPAQVAERAEEARVLMRRVGGFFLAEEKIAGVIETAKSTIGLPMTACEAEELCNLAVRTRQLCKQEKEAKRKLEAMSQMDEPIKNLSAVVGKATAAVTVVEAGSPLDHASWKQWLKSMGLNLKERSSGKFQGRLKITKRGSGRVRRWLYFAVLRLIKTDKVVRAWYARKVARDGGVKKKAIIAIMRKLAQALWHVGRGAKFDSTRMFDIKRLGLTEGT